MRNHLLTFSHAAGRDEVGSRTVEKDVHKNDGLIAHFILVGPLLRDALRRHAIGLFGSRPLFPFCLRGRSYSLRQNVRNA